MRRSSSISLSVLAVIAILVAGGWVYFRWKFPYGRSHCCILNVMFALEGYADSHGGYYPSGEASPEASLSLLYRSGALNPYTLRGMIIPEKTTRSILERGGLLSPETCGWHYVEGLTRADDTRLALLWCKEPLGHDGDRTRDGGRQVVFVGGNVEWVSGARWQSFLDDQKQLIAERSPGAVAGAPLITGIIELPDGSRMDHLDCLCTVQQQVMGTNFSSSGTTSGGLKLAWYNPPVLDGYVTRTLSFSNLISDPVTITFSNGVPDMTNYIFRMKEAR